MKCPKCGANMEITKFDDGTELVRKDCLCKIPALYFIKNEGYST